MCGSNPNLATTRSRRWWDTYRSCGRNIINKNTENTKKREDPYDSYTVQDEGRMKLEKKTRKSKKTKKQKIPKKGGPRVPGRGGSHNISSRAFLILMVPCFHRVSMDMEMNCLCCTWFIKEYEDKQDIKPRCNMTLTTRKVRFHFVFLIMILLDLFSG